MSYIKLILFFIFFLIIQIAVIPNLSFKTAFPNIMFIGMIILLLSYRFKQALLWCIVSGLFFDIYSPLLFGLFTTSFVIVYFVVRYVIQKYISDPIFPIVLCIFFIGSFVLDFGIFLLTGKDIILYLYVALYNTILGMLMYYLLKDILKIKQTYYKF